MTTTTTTPTTSVEQTVRAARPAGARPPRPSALSTSLTFGWRALLKIKHVPEQLIEVISTPIIFTLLFTYLFGGALAGSTSAYLQFLLPGTLVMTVVFVSVFTGVGLNTDITTGVFDRFRSLPIWPPSALVGVLLGDAARNTLASTIVIGLGLAMGFRPGGGGVGVVLAVLLTPRVRLQPVMGLDDARLGPANTQLGQQRRSAGRVPPGIREQRLRRPSDHARLATGLRRHQPHQLPGDGGTRTDGGNGDGWAARRDIPDVRRAHRRLRAAHRVPLPAQDVALRMMCACLPARPLVEWAEPGARVMRDAWAVTRDV